MPDLKDFEINQLGKIKIIYKDKWIFLYEIANKIRIFNTINYKWEYLLKTKHLSYIKCKNEFLRLRGEI
jgi:hypothetical protein